MVLGGSRDPAQAELDRTLRELVTRQKAIDKRVERLETLEFDQKSIGQGCISFVDNDTDLALPGHATFFVEFPNTPLASTNETYSQATIFWALRTNDSAAMVNLYMRWGLGGAGVALANYEYTYKYSRGGAIAANIGLGGQTEWLIGRVPGGVPGGVYEASGRVIVPFHSGGTHISVIGDWAGQDTTQGANAQEERGEFAGHYLSTALTVRSFDIFAAAGNLAGSVYLYGWCPEMTTVGGPDD